MQGLADGYFVLPYTIGNYLADLLGKPAVDTKHEAFTSATKSVEDETKRWLSTNGTKSVDHYHRELGKIMWEHVGMGRNENGLEKADFRDPRAAPGVPQERAGAGLWRDAQSVP